MIRHLYSRHGSLFRERRMLRMAPDQQEQIRQLEERNAALQKQVEELKTTVERLEKSMNSTKKVVNGPNFPVRQNGVVLPRAAQNSPAARDPRMQARMRQMASVRNLDALLHVIPQEHRSGEKVLKVKPIPQPWTPEERENIYEPTHPTLGRIRFVKQDGQWAYEGIVMTPDDLRNDQLRIQQRYADEELQRKHYERQLSINLARARRGDPLPVNRDDDYAYDEYLYQMSKGRVKVEQWDPNNEYNRPGYTFVPNTVASKRAAMGQRPEANRPIANEAQQVDNRTPQEWRADVQKKVDEKMRQLGKSLHVETFMLPGLLGGVGEDGRGGSGLSMKILVPDEVSGIRGMNQITYMVGSGRFANASMETMARRAGITFLTGGGEVEVHFAKPGKYAVWSEAGYDVPGPTTKRRIIHERRDVEVKGLPPVDPMQLAVERQKYKEAGELPIGTWAKIPTAAPDGKGGVFMYRTGARNARGDYIVQAYSPKAGLSQYDNATGRWSFPGGKAFTYKQLDDEYAKLFAPGQPAQQAAAVPNQPAQQPAPNKQPEQPKMDLDTFKNLLAREGITVDGAWLKDDGTWQKLNKALGSLGNDYAYLKGRTISMPGTNFPNANGFLLPNDPDQDRVNGQLRAYVEFVKANPAPQPILKIENVPNEEPPAGEVQPPKPSAPAQPEKPEQKNAPVVQAPTQKEVPSGSEKPKSAGVEKNDNITEAQPSIDGLLKDSLDDGNINRKSQLNQIRAVKSGQIQVTADFAKNVGDNGLLLTKKEVTELFEEYKNGTAREKNLLKPVLQTIEKYLASKVPPAKEGHGVPDAPAQLPGAEQVNVIKPTQEQKEQLRGEIVEIGNKYEVDLDAIIEDGEYASVKNNLPRIELMLKNMYSNAQLTNLIAYKNYDKGRLCTKILLTTRKSGVSTQRIYVNVNEEDDAMVQNFLSGMDQMKAMVLIDSDIAKLGAPFAIDPYMEGDFEKVQQSMKSLLAEYGKLTPDQKNAIKQSKTQLLVSNQDSGYVKDATYVNCLKGADSIQKTLLASVERKTSPST